MSVNPEPAAEYTEPTLTTELRVADWGELKEAYKKFKAEQKQRLAGKAAADSDDAKAGNGAKQNKARAYNIRTHAVAVCSSLHGAEAKAQ